jgi:hypothetical protein
LSNEPPAASMQSCTCEEYAAMGSGCPRNLFGQWLGAVLGTLEQLAFLLRRELSKQNSEWIQTLPSQTPRAMERKNSKARGPNRHFVKAATTFSRLIACSTLKMLLMGGI